MFTAPLFSALCALSAYLLVKEIRGQGAGLCAAAFMGLIPSYISRCPLCQSCLEGRESGLLGFMRLAGHESGLER